MFDNKIFVCYIIQLYQMERTQIDREINQAVTLISKKEIYQTKLFWFLCLIYVQIALNALINPMVFTNPLFKCHGQIQNQAYACANFDKCRYQNDFTATYYSGLYCEKRDLRMTIQSIFGVGSIFGTLIIPILSDLRGRWFATNASLLSMLFGSLFILLGVLSGSYGTIGIGMFLSAFGSLAMDAITYSLSTDYLVGETKQKAVIYFYAIWGLTDIPVSFIWFIIPYWLFFVFFLLLVPITFLYFTFRCFFMESIYYLIHAHKNEENVISVLEEMAKINEATNSQLQRAKKIIKIAQRDQMSCKQEEPSFKQKMNIIIKSPKYLRSFIYITFIKMSAYVFYYGVQGCLERTGFNFGSSTFIFGLGEFTGFMAGSKIAPYQNRRTVLIVGSLITAIIGITFITQTVRLNPLLASIILYFIFVSDCYKFSALCLLESESFGSSIRSTAVGVSFSASYTVRLFIPFFIGYFNEKGIHPIIASSVLMISIGIVPSYLIDETYVDPELKEPLSQKQIEMTEKMGECNRNLAKEELTEIKIH